jgi:hypothetical protein
MIGGQWYQRDADVRELDFGVAVGRIVVAIDGEVAQDSHTGGVHGDHHHALRCESL